MKSYKVVDFGKPLQKVEESNPSPQGTEVLVRIHGAELIPMTPTCAQAPMP